MCMMSTPYAIRPLCHTLDRAALPCSRSRLLCGSWTELAVTAPMMNPHVHKYLSCLRGYMCRQDGTVPIRATSGSPDELSRTHFRWNSSQSMPNSARHWSVATGPAYLRRAILAVKLQPNRVPNLMAGAETNLLISAPCQRPPIFRSLKAQDGNSLLILALHSAACIATRLDRDKVVWSGRIREQGTINRLMEDSDLSLFWTTGSLV
ncbi:hypothetical protein B0J13DRAFT_540784 [Dactylonectria estremocensis]|uniref:Uncharacterized protein n=1 Tax=Dactylonectria estremocensis TaxID=1079267 RepID=A0A9P9JG80_9HYPO|nr:hypothetical protein B0J13DRAFT_540784 [Dactylonectria estremocensis]